MQSRWVRGLTATDDESTTVLSCVIAAPSSGLLRALSCQPHEFR